MFYIVYYSVSWWDWILKGVKENNHITKLEVVRERNLCKRIIRKLLSFISIRYPFLYYDKSFIAKIKEFGIDDEILLLNLAACFTIEEILTFTDQIPLHVGKNIWFSNTCDKYYGEKTKDYLNQLKKKGYHLYTFDKKDGIKYDLKVLNQVFREIEFKDKISIEYDFYFLGLAKDRFEKIKRINDCLEEMGFKTNFLILEDTQGIIPYEENIELLQKAKCVVDIGQKEQNGLTFRPLEALFLDKKLLTDYVDITQFDFYNPNNIFVWGIDNLANLKNFVYSDIVPVSSEIKKKYEINYWLRNFISNK